MLANVNTNKQFYLEPLIVHEYIQLRSKVKTLDVHQSLPWILFSDMEGNIIIFDVIERKPVRAFNIQNYFQEQVNIKDLKFFDVNDKKFVVNYDITEIKKIKGISLHIRSSLLILTLDKYICFYSYILQNFSRVISQADLEQKIPVKCELFNYLYSIIQTDDGSLVIWNLLDWTPVRTIGKTNLLNKPVAYFTVISTRNEDRYITCANKNGNIFLIDITKKDIAYTRLDAEKSEHDALVTSMDFSPHTNMLASVSKNAIHIVDITNPKMFKKIPNFQYAKSEKIAGIAINLNSNFNQYSYFVHGKTPCLSVLDLNLDLIKDLKIDSKNVKTHLSYSFDIEQQHLHKLADKAFKIYIVKFLLNVTDYIIIGTNKGLVILRIEPLFKPDITPCPKLIELNDSMLYFYYVKSNTLLEQSLSKTTIDGKSTFTDKISISVKNVFDNKVALMTGFYRYKIAFSYDGGYMSCLDSYNDTFSIFQLGINEELKHNFTNIKYGKGIEIEWCPYDLIFACVNVNSFAYKHVPHEKGKQSSSQTVKSLFTLTVFRITDTSVNTIYAIENLPAHRLFGGFYIGVMGNVVTGGEETFTYPGMKSTFNYQVSGQLIINFYQWQEKGKLNLQLSEEPKFIVTSSDLQYMIIVFNDKYVKYSVDLQTSALNPEGIYYQTVSDGWIYENFIFVFLTDKGIYFHILTDDNGYPYKLLRLSDELNNYHLKISKKIKEKGVFYSKKLFPQKILGIYNNYIVLSSSFRELTIKECDHILFKIVHYIIKRRFNDISQLLPVLEKKYIKSVLAIFKYYFNNNEDIIRKIFINEELIEHFQLYRHLDCFLDDLIRSPKEENRVMVDKILRSQLVKAILQRDESGVNNLYQLANKSELTQEILCSKYIDQSTFLKSMLLHNRNFESFVFNENYKLNDQMGEKILARAYERLNQFKK